MCGVACSGLCIVIMCSKHALTLGADVTFIDCASFSETNTPDVKCASTMNTIDMFWVHSFWFLTFRCFTILFNFCSFLIFREIISASCDCSSCARDSSFPSFKALFWMSGATISSFSSSLVNSSNWSVSLCSPEIRFFRIQLPEGSRIRSCVSSG